MFVLVQGGSGSGSNPMVGMSAPPASSMEGTAIRELELGLCVEIGRCGDDV